MAGWLFRAGPGRVAAVRIFYDTEFLEDGRTIDLISIGMVADDGREYYAVAEDDALISRAYQHPWLRENVIPSLPVQLAGVGAIWHWDDFHADRIHLKPRGMIAREVSDFILAAPGPQLWAWYAAYDHVVLCQLWGRMIDLPEGVPMWTNDLKQECVRLGDPRMPEQESGEHNALADARHVKAMAAFLDGLR